MEERNYCVYKHTTPSGKVYIGITKQEPEKRWGNGNNYCQNRYFHSAIKKYGWENIKHEILVSGLTRSEAEAMEIAEIEKNKSSERKFGYNLTKGGEKAGKYTEESKRKMSLAKVGKTPWNKGIPLTDEQRKKMSNSLKGRTSPRKGCTATEETRKKLSESHKGKVSPRRKAVRDIESGEIFTSLHDAAEKTGACVQSISSVCRGKLTKTKGRRFEFV